MVDLCSVGGGSVVSGSSENRFGVWPDGEGLNDGARRRLDAEAGSRCAFELLRALGVALTISAGETAPAMALGRCLGQLDVAARHVFAERVSTRVGEITPSVIERIFSIAIQRG